MVEPTQQPINIEQKMGEISAVILRLETGQQQMTKLQAKMFTSMAVMEKVLSDLDENKASDCAPRIKELETDTIRCKGLRVGPRLTEVENQQKTMVFGAVKLMFVAFVSAVIGASIRTFWK